jgi:hypothetical protein
MSRSVPGDATTLRAEPPAVDAWDFGLHDGRVVEVPPPSGLRPFAVGFMCGEHGFRRLAMG